MFYEMKFKISSSTSATLNHMVLKIIVILGQILSVPLFLSNYPHNQYILWLILNALATFMLFADSGVIQTYSIPLTKEYLDTGFVNRIIIRRLKNRLVLAQSLLIVCVSLVFYFFEIGDGSEQNSERFSLFILLVLANVLTVFQHYFLVYYQIRNEYSNGIFRISVGKIVEVLLQIFIVSLGANLLILVAAILIVRALSVVSMALVVRQLIYSLEPPVSGARQVLDSFLGTTAVTSTIILSSHGLLIVVGQWSSTKGVLLFTISRMMCSPIRLIADSISLGTFPTLVRSSNSNSDKIDFKQLRIREFLLFSIVFIIVIIGVGRYAFDFLVHGSLDYNLNFILLVGLSTLLDGLLIIILQQVIALGNIRKIGISYLVITSVELILLALLPALQQVSLAMWLNILGDSILLLSILRDMESRKS